MQPLLGGVLGWAQAPVPLATGRCLFGEEQVRERRSKIGNGGCSRTGEQSTAGRARDAAKTLEPRNAKPRQNARVGEGEEPVQDVADKTRPRPEEAMWESGDWLLVSTSSTQFAHPPPSCHAMCRGENGEVSSCDSISYTAVLVLTAPEHGNFLGRLVSSPLLSLTRRARHCS